MSYIHQPATTQHDEYQWPAIRRLGWTPNRSAHVVCGVGVRPAGDYPCDGPYPCDEYSDRPGWKPGRAALLSLHRCRGRELIADPNVTPNSEVCRYHYGAGWTVNRRGRMVPVVCCIPNEDDRTAGGAQVVHASYGRVTVRGAEERPTSDLLSHATPGRACIVAEIDLPESSVVVVDNDAPPCGDIR